MAYTCGPWSVRPVTLDGPARPVRMASLPAAPAEHLAVTCHGVLVARCGSVAELAAVLPFPLTDLTEA